MKVSVIIPTYNRAKNITETINSILNQTYKEFELIIIDNCSEDNTEKVIEEYIKKDNRIKYFKHPNNGIVAVNRNFGIEKTAGEFIAFCDDDDLWVPTKLQIQIREFDKDPLVGMVCSNAMKFNQIGNLGLIHIDHDEQILSFSALMHSNKVITSSVILRKTALEEMGVFDENAEIFTVEDLDLWLRLVKKYRIKYVDLPLVRYRVHATQASGDILNLFNMGHYRKRKIIYSKYKTTDPFLVEKSLRFILTIIKLTRIKEKLNQKKIKMVDLLKDKSLNLNDKIRIIYLFSQNRFIIRHFYNLIDRIYNKLTSVLKILKLQ